MSNVNISAIPQKPNLMSNALRVLFKFRLAFFLLFLCIYFGVASSHSAGQNVFFTGANFVNISQQIAVNLILAVGMTFIIISGGIDLSIGSAVALAAVVGTSAMVNGFAIGGHMILPKQSPFLAVPIGVLFACGVGVLIGAINGIAITWGRIAPFIVTLAMMTAARGLAWVYNDARPVVGLPEAYNNIGGTASNPVPTYISLVIWAIGYILLSKTSFGRYVYAVGGNEQAAKLSGVDVNKVKLKVYILMGFLVGVAAVVQSARLYAGDANMGELFELNAIAAVVLGGASLAGGQGNLFGTLLGAVVIGVLDTGLQQIGAQAYWQKVDKGLVIFLAVFVDQLQNRLKKS